MAERAFTTDKETPFPTGQFFYSRTNLKGVITEANQIFAETSGYRLEEMIGKPHKIVRHPDMPREAFEDLWRDLKAGLPWRGVIKNRRSDGGFYWVVSNTAPVREDGRIVGYQSVRTCPTQAQIKAASAAYQRIQAHDGSIRILHGNIVPVRSELISTITSLKAQLCIPVLIALLGALLGAAGILWGAGHQILQGVAVASEAIVSVLAVFLLAFYLPRLFRDIHRIDAFLDERLQTGDLRDVIDLQRHDDLGKIGHKLGLLVSWFRASMMCVGDAVNSVQRTTDEVVENADKIDSATHAQNAATTSVAAAMEEMSLSIREIANRLQNTESTVSSTGQKASAGAGVSQKATEQIQSMARAIKDVTVQVEQLSGSSAQIGEIASAIREIADQTNLLALNAAIEAARAGEAGRGFAIVANEVRTLADRTMKATQKIDRLVVNIKTDSDLAIQGIRAGAGRVEASVTGVGELESVLQEINTLMSDAVKMVTEINVASGQQTEAVSDVSGNISKVAAMTEESSTVASHTASLISALVPLVGRAEAIVEQYSVL